jgi:hypothetical protein
MANVKLSAAEIELVTNSSLLLTKKKIIDAIYIQMGSWQLSFKNLMEQKNKAVTLINTNAKIYKGENYENLPWVALDYPKIIAKDDLFIIRIFFWWGQYCSINLIAKGKFKNTINPNLLATVCANWFVYTGDDIWEMNMYTRHFTLIKNAINMPRHDKNFIKIAKKIPLSQWDSMNNFIMNSFEELLQILVTQTVE